MSPSPDTTLTGSASRLTVAPRSTRFTLVGLFHVPAINGAPLRARRRTARGVIVWFVVGALALHAAALVALDAPWPNLRDPEYGWRAHRLRARAAEQPERPLVLVVGSSRTCMGVRPAAWEAARPGAPDDPLLFNFGTVGAGPVQQLIAVRRLYADGFRPAAVLLEYWAPLLRQDGPFAEQRRVGGRLRFDDRAVVRDYFPDPDRAERVLLATRLHPLYANRDRWAALALPRHLPANPHANLAWRDMDSWGWVPGLDVSPGDAATRATFLAHYREDYRRQFDGHTIHPGSDRALREAVALVRARGARVGFVHLPESSEFRAWYPPDVERAGRERLAALAHDLNVPVIDAREWMSDDQLADGHHLSRIGAGAFTERFGPAVAHAFPTSGGPR